MSSADPSAAPQGGNGRFVVAVDHGQCSGTAHCQQSMPDVFVVIDRKSFIRPSVDWSMIDRDELEAVVDACPWFAISVTDTPLQPTPGGTPDA